MNCVYLSAQNTAQNGIVFCSYAGNLKAQIYAPTIFPVISFGSMINIPQGKLISGEL